MSEQSHPDGPGADRGSGALRRVARTALWPPRRFFDPRFSGIDDHIEMVRDTVRELTEPLRVLLAHVDVGRAERDAGEARQELWLRELRDLLVTQVQAMTTATTVIGRSVAEQRATIEAALGRIEPVDGDLLARAPAARVEELDVDTAALVDYATSHRGFAAQRELWFNPPTVLRHDAGDVTLSQLTERIVEPAYVFRALAGVPAGGRILDVGAAESTVSVSLASLGYEVTAVDPRPYPIAHPRLRAVRGEVEDLDEPPFDAVVCLSTIEHVGLGAYGIAAREDGDLAAMRRLRELTVPGGLLVLTTPYGRAEVQETQRVYDRAALDRLLEGLDVEDVTIVRRTEATVWQADETATDDGHAVALVTARRPAA